MFDGRACEDRISSCTNDCQTSPMPPSDTRTRLEAVSKLAMIVAGLVLLLAAAGPFKPWDLIFEGAVLISSLLLVGGLPSVNNFCTRVFAVLDRISRAANLKDDIDLPREARRINLLRIALGAVFLWRWVFLLPLALDVQHDVYSVVTASAVILTGVCLMIGFFTPIASIVLCLGAIRSFDYSFAASTLGLFGAPSMARSRVGRLFAVASYSTLCLYSILMHRNDSAWTSGYVNLQIFSSFYASQHPEFFQWLYQTYPSLTVLLSRLSIYLMMVWELCFGVFLFFKPGRHYVLWIGVIFFLISGFFLQLSYLPWVEFCFFALIFWQGWGLNVDGRRSLTVFFDDRCRLCDGTMRFLSKVDLFGIIRPLGLSRSVTEIASAGLTEAQVMNDLCGRADQSPGRLYCGYDLYLELARRLVLLAPVWPLLWIGAFTGIGPLAYRAIAERRRRIFGTCSPSTITENDFRPSHAADIACIADRTIWPSAFMLVYLFLFACYLSGTLLFPRSLWLRQPLTESLYYVPFDVGLVPIDVFNKQDLGMENNFVTVEAHRAGSPDDRVLLPYLDRNGRRLAWHRSDRFYFGSSLVLRRSMIDYRNYCFMDSDLHLKVFRTLFELASLKGFVGPYYVTYYGIPDWDYARMRDPSHKSFVPYKVCEITLDQDGTVQNRVEFVPVNIARTN